MGTLQEDLAELKKLQKNFEDQKRISENIESIKKQIEKYEKDSDECRRRKKAKVTSHEDKVKARQKETRSKMAEEMITKWKNRFPKLCLFAILLLALITVVEIVFMVTDDFVLGAMSGEGDPNVLGLVIAAIAYLFGFSGSLCAIAAGIIEDNKAYFLILVPGIPCSIAGLIGLGAHCLLYWILPTICFAIAFPVLLYMDNSNWGAYRRLQDAEPTFQEQEELNKAKAADRAEMQKIIQSKNQELEKLERLIRESKEEIQSERQRYQACQEEIDSNNFLGAADKVPDKVNYLISQIENKRADSLKEALNQLDQHLYEEKRDREEKLRRLDEQLENERHHQEIEKTAKEHADAADRVARAAEAAKKAQDKAIKNLEKKLESWE